MPQPPDRRRTATCGPDASADGGGPSFERLPGVAGDTACPGRSGCGEAAAKAVRAIQSCWMALTNECPAASYSPTQFPVQYHRR